MAGKLNLSKEIPFRVAELTEASTTPNLSAIISTTYHSIIKPAMEANTMAGTKKQRPSYMTYWESFCASYNINVANFGKITKEESVEPHLRAQKVFYEVQCLAEFASDVLLFPRRKKQTNNSSAHVEKTIRAVRG